MAKVGHPEILGQGHQRQNDEEEGEFEREQQGREAGDCLIEMIDEDNIINKLSVGKEVLLLLEGRVLEAEEADWPFQNAIEVIKLKTFTLEESQLLMVEKAYSIKLKGLHLQGFQLRLKLVLLGAFPLLFLSQRLGLFFLNQRL